MPFDPEQHHRRSIRLEGYDYAQEGAYFVTICTHRRECLLGEVIGDTVRLSPFGEIVRDEWLKTAVIRPYVVLDEFIVMPNHLHGILFVAHEDRVGTWRRHVPTKRAFSAPIPHSLSTIIGSFKSAVNYRINRQRNSPGASVWQQRFHDKIIRNETMLNAIRQYIQANPARWSEDSENPANIRSGQGEFRESG